MKIPKSAASGLNLQQSEVDCMRGISGIRGTPKFYGNAFQYKDRCFKAVLSEAIDGKDLGDFMPLSREEECQLQQESGRLTCAFLRRGFVDMDFNNPGNFLLKRTLGQATQFTKIDHGGCYRQSPENQMFNYFESIASLPADSFWDTNEKLGEMHFALRGLHWIFGDWGHSWYVSRAIEDARTATRTDIANTAWRCDLAGNAISLYTGAGDLILHSQSRVHALNLQCDTVVPGSIDRITAPLQSEGKCKCPPFKFLGGDDKKCFSWTGRFSPSALQGKGCRCQ